MYNLSVIPNHNNNPEGNDTDTDEEVVDNNEDTSENCNESNVFEDHSNDEDLDNGNDSDGDGNFNCNAFIYTSDIDNFLTTTYDPLLINEYDNNDVVNYLIPTTNTNEESFEIIEEVQNGHYVSSHIILNQYMSIYRRAKHHIRSYQSHT